MQIILLSGGSGKRLWPLSNDVRSKQFIKILTTDNGSSELDSRQSMVQRVFAQIRKAQPQAEITIGTNASQVDIIKEQLGSDINIVLEPERRDTFPAIALACAYLSSEKKVSEDETVIVLPCDPYTEVDFFKTLSNLDKIISANKADISLIGIKPNMPTSKYGYIVPGNEIGGGVYNVSHFVEKPEEEKAAKLINEESAYWNSGIFAFKLGYVLNIARSNAQFTDFNDLYKNYNKLEKISFDYKVVEKTKRIAVVPFLGKWTDIGTWRALADEMPFNTLGNIIKEKNNNTFIVNELDIPIIVLGAKDLIIAASSDGILISDFNESTNLKTYIDKIEKKV